VEPMPRPRGRGYRMPARWANRIIG
jgi:hypothetical protein